MKHSRLQTACILAWCRHRISAKRQRRNAITCGPKCQKLLVSLRKQERDRRICQKCGKPCTPKERADFRQWRLDGHRVAPRKSMPENPILSAANGFRDEVYDCSDLRKKRKRDSPELISYKAAIQRCRNPHNQAYKNYGGRGIEMRFFAFSEFLEHLGPRPAGTTLHRIDNDGHYEKGNVKWATRAEQAANKRPRKRKRAA